MDKDMQPTLFEAADGHRAWKLNGEYHRTDGPAVEFVDGTLNWAFHGKFHRTDGPALIHADGSQKWFLNGRSYEFDEWLNQNPDITDEEKVMMKLKYG
jgi:hypothetical protein